MSRRSDAQNFYKQTVYTEKIDAYLKEKQEQGYPLSYLHFFVSIYVRLLFERPQLNRFVMNNQLYERAGIFISMAIKRSLRDTGEETTVKFSFAGHENIFEIAKIMDQTIYESSHMDNSNDVDKIASTIMSLPGFTKKF
jgi:hypothetical protein